MDFLLSMLMDKEEAIIFAVVFMNGLGAFLKNGTKLNNDYIPWILTIVGLALGWFVIDKSVYGVLAGAMCCMSSTGGHQLLKTAKHLFSKDVEQKVEGDVLSTLAKVMQQTSEEHPVRFGLLESTIKTAKMLLTDTTVYQDGVSLMQVPSGVEFWYMSDIATMETAVEIAETLLNEKSATQEEVDDAILKLNIAKTEFRVAKHIGTHSTSQPQHQDDYGKYDKI